MKRKSLIIPTILLATIFLLASCTTNYDKDAIADYVKETVLISDFTVSKEYEEIKGEDGYTDRLWTVEDNENNITFHILDDYFYGMESVSNRLKDDYDASIFCLLYDELDKKDNILINKDDSGSLITVELLSSYENKDELIKCYDSILSYKNQVIDAGYNLEIPYSVEYDFELKKIGYYEVNTGVKKGYLNEVNEDMYEDMIYDYYSTALTYQLENALLEMNSIDKNLVMRHKDTHRIFKKLDNDTIEYYDDVIASENYYGISFGGLYKILVDEGFKVEGNSWHYVVEVGGDTYEFSYDFNDYEYDNYEDCYGYYYKKNGKKVKMNAYFHNCLKALEINKMFGLNIEESANRFISKEY